MKAGCSFPVSTLHLLSCQKCCLLGWTKPQRSEHVLQGGTRTNLHAWDFASFWSFKDRITRINAEIKREIYNTGALAGTGGISVVLPRECQWFLRFEFLHGVSCQSLCSSHLWCTESVLQFPPQHESWISKGSVNVKKLIISFAPLLLFENFARLQSFCKILVSAPPHS